MARKGHVIQVAINEQNLVPYIVCVSTHPRQPAAVDCHRHATELAMVPMDIVTQRSSSA